MRTRSDWARGVDNVFVLCFINSKRISGGEEREGKCDETSHWLYSYKRKGSDFRYFVNGRVGQFTRKKRENDRRRE